MTEGVPQFRIFYRGVTVTALNRQTVRIRLPAPDKDLMLGLLTLPVISQTFWQTRKFNEPLSQPPCRVGLIASVSGSWASLLNSVA